MARELENIRSYGIDYRLITNNSSEWMDVPTGDTFYDLETKKAYYKDPTGIVIDVWGFGFGAETTSPVFGWKYKETELDSLAIQELATNLQTILDNSLIAANQYYELDTVILEYVPGATAYNHTGKSILLKSSNETVKIDAAGFLSQIVDTKVVIAKFGPSSVVSANSFVSSSLIDADVTLQFDGGSNATEGDGTLLIKTWYQVRTIGTAL